MRLLSSEYSTLHLVTHSTKLFEPQTCSILDERILKTRAIICHTKILIPVKVKPSSTSTRAPYLHPHLILMPKHGIEGVNAYAILASPRAPRNEAMVISASWLSRTGEGDGTLNLRGVSTVLALARFLKSVFSGSTSTYCC